MTTPAAAALLAEIRSLQRATGHVRFDRFMELVLYHPSHGYFARSSSRAGRAGDFLTSPELSPLFGATLMGWVRSMAPARGILNVVEVGAGRGTLAASLVAAIPPSLRERVRLHLVERAAAPREALKQTLSASVRTAVASVYESIDALPAEFEFGVVIGNELFDNLPARRVMLADGLQEICVRHERGRLKEILVPADPELARIARDHGVRLSEGQSAEVCPEAVPLLESVLRRLSSGAFVFFDYGGEATEVSGAAAPQGGLVAHRGHSSTRDFYSHLGDQDISARVNFTPLLEAARRIGFQVRLSAQADFLVRQGLPDRLIEAIEKEPDGLQKLRLTQQAKQLYHPEGMGGAFRVMLGQRGLPPTT